MHHCSAKSSDCTGLASLPVLMACGLLLLLLSACGPGGKSYRINGTIAGMKTGELYIYQPSDEHARFDTIQVKDGKFRYFGETGGTAPVFLLFPNALEQVIFVEGGQTLDYQAEANRLQAYTVDGSDENKLLNELRKQTYGLDPKRAADKYAQFIRKHTRSAAAVYVFQRYFLQDQTTSLSRLGELLGLLRRQQPDDRQLLAAEGRIRQLESGRPGSLAPDLVIQGAGRHSVRLRRPDKDFLLLTFWATWMQNTWEYNTTLQDIHSLYDGRLATASVSLDTQVFKWQEYVGTDTLTRLHLCDGMSWDNAAVKALGVRHLPTYFIIDRRGTIRKRGTDLGSLRRNLSELLP